MEEKSYKTKNGVKFLKEPEYIVNPAKGVVVCVMKVLFPGHTKPLTFTVKAAQNPADEFCQGVGMKLARSRAKHSIYKAAAKDYKKQVAKKTAEIHELTRLADRLDYLVGMESDFQEMVIKDPRP
jgi:hypothetical protein